MFICNEKIKTILVFFLYDIYAKMHENTFRTVRERKTSIFIFLHRYIFRHLISAFVRFC